MLILRFSLYSPHNVVRHLGLGICPSTSHSHTHSLSLVLVVTMRSKELKTSRSIIMLILRFSLCWFSQILSLLSRSILMLILRFSLYSLLIPLVDLIVWTGLVAAGLIEQSTRLNMPQHAGLVQPQNLAQHQHQNLRQMAEAVINTAMLGPGPSSEAAPKGEAAENPGSTAPKEAPNISNPS